MSEEDSELLASWLRDAQAEKNTDDAADAALRDYLLAGTDDAQSRRRTDEDLRMFGLNYRERARVQEPSRERREGWSPINRKRQLARFAWYLREDFKQWPPQGASVTACAEVWFTLTNGDLELARRWWASGLHPANLDRARDLMTHGFTPDELRQQVAGRSIMENLARGSSAQWCRMALDLNKKARRRG